MQVRAAFAYSDEMAVRPFGHDRAFVNRSALPILTGIVTVLMIPTLSPREHQGNLLRCRGLTAFAQRLPHPFLCFAGMSRGHIAILIPIASSLSAGSLDYAGLTMVVACAGRMITPVHLCPTISVDYFKANFFKTVRPIADCEVILLSLFSVRIYLTRAG